MSRSSSLIGGAYVPEGGSGVKKVDWPNGLAIKQRRPTLRGWAHEVFGLGRPTEPTGEDLRLTEPE
jgi:hypothetical protein